MAVSGMDGFASLKQSSHRQNNKLGSGTDGNPRYDAIH